MSTKNGEQTKKKRGQGEWCYYQRKNGIWEARKQFGKKENGSPNIKALFGKTITEVRNKAKEYEKSLAANNPVVVSKTSVYDYVDNYLKTYKMMSVKRTTYDGMEDALNIRIKPFDISSMQMHNLNVQICQDYINELTACPKKYSLATITKTYNLLNNCFKYAVKVGDMTSNPMEYVNLPSSDIVQTPKKDIMFFTFEQVKQIVAQCNKKFSTGKPIYQYGNMLILMLFTGIRIGECVGLTWEDVDLDKNNIRINNTVATVKARGENTTKKRVTTDTSPKTRKSNRTIPLSETAREVITSLNTHDKRPTAYVFTTQTGNVVSARNVERCLEYVLKACNIPNYKEYSLHCLRHTFVSMLLAKHVDIKVISELLGHEKVSTTYNIYAHLMPNTKEESVKSLDNLDDVS